MEHSRYFTSHSGVSIFHFHACASQGWIMMLGFYNLSLHKAINVYKHKTKPSPWAVENDKRCMHALTGRGQGPPRLSALTHSHTSRAHPSPSLSGSSYPGKVLLNPHQLGWAVMTAQAKRENHAISHTFLKCNGVLRKSTCDKRYVLSCKDERPLNRVCDDGQMRGEWQTEHILINFKKRAQRQMWVLHTDNDNNNLE